VRDYLQVSQPVPSDTVLNNNDVIEYRSRCGNCFVWKQPLNFDIQEQVRRWNTIEVDQCVESDILNNLHHACNNQCSTQTNQCYSEYQTQDICGCSPTCYKTKIGLTATNIPSDIIFNTELSGIPVFVNYYSRNPWTLNFEVEDITDGGIYVPPVSTLFSEAQSPWKNLINDQKPWTIIGQDSMLYTHAELGLFTPDKLATGKYELRNGKYELNTSNRSLTSVDLIRDEADLPVISTDSSWMKRYNGHIDLNGVQTYYPYTTNSEIGINNLGLQENYILDYASLSANERGQKLINCGDSAYYNTMPFLTGNVIDWQQDIWGNQYFMINNDTKSRLENNTVYSELYIKTIDGQIHRM
jgi:hypothetical protein